MRISKPFAAISVVLALSGCSTFSDVSFNEQAKSNLAQIANSSELEFAGTQARLSSLMSNDELDGLIAKALTNNPSLMQTLMTLKVSQQQLRQTNSDEWPSVNASVSSDRQQSSSTNYAAGLTLDWTLDIWQQLDNNTSVQLAQALASEYSLQGAKDLLVANVMQTYLELVQYAQLIDIQKETVAALQSNEQIIVSRYRKGLTDLNDLDTAKSNTQSAQATLVNYQHLYQQIQANLALLTGANDVAVTYLTDYPKVLIVDNELNTSGLGQRPDLKQAYQAILASQYQHKVAYKALLPNFSLSASVSNSDSSLHDALFGSSAWQLLGQITAPLFNAGYLTSQVEIAKLNAEQSYWAFQETLLDAVNDVEQAMRSEQALTRQLELTTQAYESSKRSEINYTERYRQGTVSLIDLLQVQQSTFSLKSQISQLTYQRLSNRIELGLALGYGV